jgi:hypothetical protein
VETIQQTQKTWTQTKHYNCLCTPSGFIRFWVDSLVSVNMD